ncbi:alkane 1-monooxygenase [Parvularcula lutaonensis]|uniref:Alkane 1-monooxygenase n=1 Tax=Parvularcula lutaonensis TaxID=491923 RepID=A0ABV7MA15_9PROT|nr:alkane 1-monooxygenase [Parvularcula lutaonensis]GGY36589.1 alkane monooxygenase [Parvularcula lutaonensis]
MSTTLRLDHKPTDVIRAPRKWMFLLGIPSAMVPTICVAAYYAFGQQPWIAVLPFIWFFICIPILDAVVGEDLTNPPPEDFERLAADRFYTNIIFASLPVYFLNFVFGIMLLVDGLPVWAMLPFLYTIGIGGGQVLIIAHELGHRTNRLDRNIAKLALGLIGYGHFCIEHNRGHHVNVATPEDCSSARMNETVYAFMFRDIIGAFVGGWKQEAKRLRNRGQPVFSHHNEILQSYAITVLIAAAMVAWLGWAALPFIIAHHFLAFFALTMVNYIEHYGLKREKLPNGRYEPCQPHHSWNTNHTVSNLLEINLQRHSDHHANPMRPYQCLRNFEELPRLPSGYPGCITMSLIPPLWFRVMNPKVLAWAGGDKSKLNWG